MEEEEEKQEEGSQQGEPRLTGYSNESQPTEAAYYYWMEKWGHVDFEHLFFLPKIKDKNQLLAFRKLQEK